MLLPTQSIARITALSALLAVALLMLACSGTSSVNPVSSVTPNSPTQTPAPYRVAEYGDTIEIPAGSWTYTIIEMEPGQRMEGLVTVKEPTNGQLRLKTQAPDQNDSVDLGPIVGSQTFSLVATTSGNYRVWFDNTSTGAEPKMVEFKITVWSE